MQPQVPPARAQRENKAMAPILKPTQGQGWPHVIYALRLQPVKEHQDSPDAGVPSSAADTDVLENPGFISLKSHSGPRSTASAAPSTGVWPHQHL